MTDPKKPHKGTDPSDSDKVEAQAADARAEKATLDENAQQGPGEPQAHEHGPRHGEPGHVHGPHCNHDHDDKPEAITIDPEDLTPDAKANAEKELRRSIPDHPYTLKSRAAKPGSIVEIQFEIGGDIYQSEQNLLLNDLRKEIVLPGFRKGKAPLNLIMKRVGKDAERDTVRSLAINALRQEMAKEKIDLLSKPRIVDFSVPVKGEGGVSATIEIETQPVVELKEYKGITVEAEERPVTDEMVNGRIEELRRQNATQETASADHGLQTQDTVTVDIEAVGEGGEVLKHLSRQNEILYDFEHRLPAELAGQMVGKKAGETITAKIKNKTQNRRGEEVEHEDSFTLTIKEIKTTKLPDLDDDFAKDLGDYESLDDLRKKTRQELEKGEEDRRRTEGLGKLYRQIVERNPVDVPHSLVAQQQYRLIMEDSQQMQRYGLKLEQVVQDVDKYLADQRASADEIVRLQLLMAKLGDVEKLEVGDADVDAEIARIAEESGRKPLAVRARLEAQNQLEEFRKGLSKKKVGDFLTANNTIKYVAPKPAEEPAAAEAAPTEESEAKPKKSKAKTKATEKAADEGAAESKPEPKKGRAKKSE